MSSACPNQVDFTQVDLNATLHALASNSCGPTEPVNPLEYQFWLDTSMRTGNSGSVVLKIRINDEWVPVFVNGVDNPLLNQFDGQNMIINGEMRIDQRHEGGVIPMVQGGYSLDRWKMVYGKAPGAVTIQRTSTDVTSQPYAAGLTHALTFSAASALTIETNDAVMVNYDLEGQDCAKLAYGSPNAKPLTVSFWVKSSFAGTHPFRARIKLEGGGSEFFFTSYEVTTANVWEKVSVLIGANTNPTALIAEGAQAGYQLSFAALWQKGLSADPSYQSAWGTSSTISTNFQPFSVFDQPGGSLSITGVKMEEGETSTALDIPTVSQSLAACQRYYEKTFLPGVAPADVTLAADTDGCLHGGNWQSGFNWEPVARWDFSVSKARKPTVELYRAHPLGTGGQWTTASGESSVNAQSVYPGTEGVNIDNSNVNLRTCSDQMFIHAVADAEVG